MIQLKHIWKRYPDGFEAVRDFDLQIGDREFIILVGPSGCGKTTTLRMIAGLEEITEGELLIDGKLMNEVEPKDRDIAMVFQNYALYPHMTVFENIAFGLMMRKMPKEEIRKKVHEAAKILDLESLLDRKPKSLSGGQRQRVAMGRAIVRNPKLFLMDEPLSNLDAKLRVQMRVELAKLHEDLKATIIYVTHDQMEAMSLGTRIVVMNEGAIQQADTPENLYLHPCNLFVAGFIGSPQMNFLEVTVNENQGETGVMAGESFFRVSPGTAAKLREGYLNREVIMGIRPEAIFCHREGTDPAQAGYVPKNLLRDIDGQKDLPGENTVSAQVNVYELLGDEALLYFDFAGKSFTAKVKTAFAARAGETADFVFDMERAHFFDKDTGISITDL